MLMVRHLISGLLLILLAFTACKPKSEPQTNGGDRGKPACGEGWIKNSHMDTLRSDPFELVSATMKGRCMEFTVRYGGGCGEVDFKLIWDGNLRESSPEQARLRLILDDRDNCRALLIRTFAFDVATINPGKPTVFYIENLKEPVLFDPMAGD